ncbi:pyroglutamyl-peptidase I [Tessaracoccus aquimaris]|uniref:pyroglutamyl-peptidase I family protein n=1 Tax=Tessaracoccus aquimaris TaxID=1332264 RepID=UPI0011AB702C|nr:pyroglutamyl-peptidase I [Tessaracoccus aquimaris]
MLVLVTGFEPFGGDTSNASGDAVALLRERGVPGVDLITATLPVGFASGPAALRTLIARHRPDAVVAVGEAGGRAAVTPEMWAVNAQVARIADNDGLRPTGPIDDGPERLAARLDVPALVAAIRATGVPAEASEDAGAFVCNAVFRAALTGFDGPAGFVHVPAVREGATAMVGAETDDAAPVAADLTVDDLATALAAVLRAIA